jgi:hypothetical protein
MSKSPSLIGIVLIAVLLTLSACTRVVAVRVSATDLSSGSAAITEAEDADAWWSIAFRMRWDPEQTPDWYLDALLADQVCAPALAEFDPPIGLWRFHRRAANDEAGHRFSLLVYTDPLTAEVLYRQIRATSVLQWLESDARVDSVNMTKVERPELPSIARTSDAAWPSEIQASWPWYIMGVSQTWLSLIQQVTVEQPLEEPSPDALLDYYRIVNDRVTALWRDNGQHVYLHHLNALFGYQPLLIRETNLKQF